MGSGRHRGYRALLAAFAIAGFSLALCCALALAQEAAPQKPNPPILIGPSRVTLAGGKTLEAIAVFREPGRVRVVLEDDSEIVFDPAKVVSVVALADLPDTPSPTPKPAHTGTARPGKKPVAASSAPVKVHAEPAGSAKTASTKKGSPDAKSANEAADSGSAAGAVSGEAAARAKEEREREVDELAAMLQSAIANTALEGPGTGGPDDAQSGDADDEEKKAGKDATGAAKDGEVAGEDGGADAKTTYKPRPEDFDATRPVNKAGFRFLGPKGKLPETPPQSDFPKPSAPVTSLGFGTDTWRPSSGFQATATWGTPLAPATSFPNRLSGLDPPITGFGPSWWRPTPTTWSSSTFPRLWQPQDGFAQAQEQKAPPPPPK